MSDDDLEATGKRLRNEVRQWMIEWYGECPEYVAGCPACEAWDCFRAVFETVPTE